MVLYDQFGRPIETPRRPDDRQIAVASVRDRWSSYPSRGLTPERLAAILREADEGDVARQCELFTEMEEKDAHLASLLQTRRNAVIGLPRAVLPYSDDPADQESAGLVEEVLDGIDLDDLVLDLMDAVGKGYSIAEILWETGERVAPRSVEWVDPKRFAWDGHAVRLLTEAHPMDGEALPANKFIVHRYKARSGLPSRAGMLRVCAWMYLFKNYAVKDWVAFAEVFGMPLRLGKYDPAASKEDREALEAAIRALGTDAAGIIANTTDIEFLSEKSGTSGGDVYERLAAFCDRAMSKAVLGQTLTSDTTGATGTYAAGQVHDSVRRDLIEADAAAVARTLQRDLIRPIVGFNLGWDRTRRLPYIQFDTAAPEDLRATAETYGILVEKVGLPIGASHVYERFGIPAPQAGESLVGSKSEPLPMKRDARGAMALSGRVDPVQARVDGLADAAIEEGAQAIEAGLVDPLVRLVEEATDYDDLRDRILAAYQDLDPLSLQDVLARAIFMAEMGGRAHAR